MKKLIVVLILLVGAGWAAAGNMEQTSAKLYKKQGELLKSWQFYNESLRKDSLNLEAYFERGDLLENIAADTGKIELAKQIAGNVANPAEALYDLMLADFRAAQTARKPDDEGIIKKLKKRMDQILQDRWSHFYFVAVQQDSSFRAATGTDADVKRGHLRDGLYALDMAIKMLPDKWNAYALKAQMLVKLDSAAASVTNWEAALRCIQAADKNKRESEEYKLGEEVVRESMMIGYFNLGRLDDALKIANAVLNEDSCNVNAVTIKADAVARIAADTTLALEKRDSLKTAAILVLEKAKTCLKGDTAAVINILSIIGKFHLQLSDTSAAIAAFNHLLEHDAKDKEVLFILGVLYLEGGSFVNTKKARDTFGKLVDAYPDYGPAWINYGIALIRLGENAKGKAAIEKGKPLGAGR